MTDEWCPPTDEHEIPDASGALSPRSEAALGDGPPRLTVIRVAPASDVVDPVIGIGEGDIRMVDAFFHELALDASLDPRPPTAEEQAANTRIAAEIERVKAMSPDELRDEQALRLRARRRRGQR